MTNLRTSKERVKLLRAGIDYNSIQMRYLELNGLFVPNVDWED